MNASQNTRRVVVTHALRTPIGRYLGSFKDLSAADLGASVVGELVRRAGLDAGDNLYRSPSELGLERASLAEALQEVQAQYLLSVSADSLQRGVVRGMLSGLDPHSNYLSAAEYADMAEPYRGDFEGIGIYFEVRRGRLLVIAPIVGSPSYGKLRAGDHIVEIEGVPTDGIPTEEVEQSLGLFG